jgi:hypothetical protein
MITGSSESSTAGLIVIAEAAIVAPWPVACHRGFT